MEVGGAFLVASRDAAVLFESAEEALDSVALAIKVLAKGTPTALAGQSRDRDSDASPTKVRSSFSAGVPLVRHDTPGVEARSTSSGALDRSRFQQGLEVDRVMTMAWSDDHHHRFTLPLRPDVDLGS